MEGLIAVEWMVSQTQNVLYYSQIFSRYCQSKLARFYCLWQVMSGFPLGELDDCLTCLIFQVTFTANTQHEFLIVGDELFHS